KGKPVTLQFQYDGRLSGTEESPIYGIKFASIQNDFTYLLYPSRWFPVNDYQADRFTAEVKISVPSGYNVIGSGLATKATAGDKSVFSFNFTKPSFPGSIGVVKTQPVHVVSQGVTSDIYFRSGASMAQA